MLPIKAELRNYKSMVSQPYMQIVLTVPAEIALQVQNALGYPTPGESIWVGLVRLTDEAEPPPEICRIKEEA